MRRWLLPFVGALFLLTAVKSAAAKVHPKAQPSADESGLQGQILRGERKPVAGAQVFGVVRWFERSVMQPDVTDRKGRFHLTGPQASKTEIIILTANGGMTFATLGTKPTPIRLASSTTLRVAFVDENGKPYANREVAVFPTTDNSPMDGTIINHGFPRLPNALKSHLIGRTDANGRLVLPGLPQGTHVSLTLSARNDCEPLVLKGSLQLGQGTVTEATPIRLAMNGSISGRVTYRATGKPVVGAGVGLAGPGYLFPMGDAQTDADGHYRITGLFPAHFIVVMQDPHLLQNDDRGNNKYLPLARTKKGEWLLPFRYAGTAVAAGEQVKDIDFTLVQSANLIVEVRDKDGKPQFGAPVMVDLSDGSGQGKMTDIHGQCRLQVPPDRVHVYWQWERGDKPLQQQWVTPREGETCLVRLAPASAAALESPARNAVAPDFTVEDRKGKQIRLSDFRGKVVILYFWLPFGDESAGNTLRHVNAVAQKMAGKDVVALVVDISGDKKEFTAYVACHPELSALRFTWDPSDQREYGEGVISHRYAVQGGADGFVIAPNGTLVHQFDEEESAIDDEAQLERVVNGARMVH